MKTSALVDLVLHAAKYPHAAVNGVLLIQKSGHQYMIEEAVPLLHSNLTLSPMLEAALPQVEAYCRKKNLSLSGYYHVNESLPQTHGDATGMKIGEKVAQQSPLSEALFLVLNNRSLAYLSNPRTCPPLFTMYKWSDGKWKSFPWNNAEHLEEGLDSLEILAKLINEKWYQEVVDFDLHLDDPSLPWGNHDMVEAAIAAAK